MVILQNITYILPNKERLFDNINLTVNAHDKMALIGNNGTGKSTLLKIIAGELQPSGGTLSMRPRTYYVPQLFGQYNHLSVGQVLRVEDKLNALGEILNGNVNEENYALLNDDWSIEERCAGVLRHWHLSDLDLRQQMGSLSGGQKTGAFLAGISIHQPELVLLDEPSNHLDTSARRLLYDFIQSTTATLLIVSHDRKLLNLLDAVCELNRHEIKVYGGNYDFYIEQKRMEENALAQEVQNKEKALRKAKEKERETVERRQKAAVRAQKGVKSAGISRMAANTLRSKAEASASKIKTVHADKIGDIAHALSELRASAGEAGRMRFGFDHSTLHRGKVIFRCEGVNYSYGNCPLWPKNLHVEIVSGERIALQGDNGSGKTTLVRLITGALEPQTGEIYRAENRSIYIDQDYSLIDNRLSIYQQAERYNAGALLEHEVKIRLDRFLFSREVWDKPCSVLSGGERMRLMLCCLTIGSQSPDIIVLDEPTNNLDIRNIEILTAAVNEYRGTLIVVSHDETFLQQVAIQRTILLQRTYRPPGGT